MADITYQLRSLRHKFAKAVNKTPCGVRFTAVPLLLTAALGAGVWSHIDERTDHETTAQSAAAWQDATAKLQILAEEYRHLQSSENATPHSDYSEHLQEQLQENRQKHTGFDARAIPFLQTVLMTPHLSETQAETLMNSFAAQIKDPAAIDRAFDIKDYGFLREARTKSLKNNSDLDYVLNDMQYRIEKYDKRKNALAPTLLASFGVSIFLTLLGNISLHNKLRQWENERPEKPKRFKH